MREIEVKILNIDPNKVRRRILALGGRRVTSRMLFREIYFTDGTHGSKFSSLRLREEGKKILLTAKTRVDNNRFLVRNELQTEVRDLETAKRILRLLGLEVLFEREKKRQEFTLGACNIFIDEYPGIPAYMEIEGRNKSSVKKVLDVLDFDLRYTSTLTATEVIRRYGKNPKKLKFKTGPSSKT